jgi:long-chain acyl-CoA synthetase
MPDAAGNPHVHAAVRGVGSGGDADAGEGEAQILAAAVHRANAALAPHQRITGFSRWPGDDFPRTPAQKVKRQEVRAVLSGAAPRAPAYRLTDPAADPASRLRRILADVGRVAPETVRPESDLALDLHLDSLSLLVLALHLEEELGVVVDEADLARARTCAEVGALVERQQAAPSQSPPQPRWALHPAVRPLRGALQAAVLLPACARVCRPFEVRGAAHLRGLSLPALFVANHASHLDTPSVLRALPPRIRRRVAVAAAADYFYRNRWIGGALSLLWNTFPFCREGPVRASLAYCGELIDAGWSILLYPEGTRSATGELQPFKSGIGLLARELQVPVVPIAIEGTYRVLPKGGRRPHAGPVTVRIGRPVIVARGADSVAISTDLHDTLGHLLAEEGR